MLASSWARDKIDITHLDQFKLVFLIPARELSSSVTFIDYIVDHLLKSTGCEKESLIELLEEEQEQILFMIDGYDELYSRTNESLTRLMQGSVFKQSSIIVTTRPAKQAIDKVFRWHRKYQLMGLSSEQVDNFIGSHLGLSLSEVHALSYYTDITKNPLSNNPSFLRRMGFAFIENPQIESYTSLLSTIVHHTCKQAEYLLNKSLIVVESDLDDICQLAYQCMRDEFFECQQSSMNYFGKLLGFIKPIPSAKIHSHSFTHRIILEHLAARYITSQAEITVERILNNLLPGM